MISGAYIKEWWQKVPWSHNDQVEHAAGSWIRQASWRHCGRGGKLRVVDEY